MKAQVFLTPGEFDAAEVPEATVVVIDVIRATTTIVEALANGARAIFPTASTEEAVRLASSLGREDALLCGERRALKVEGFDLGNSPAEFTREAVEGKRLVMSTTNGTRALARAREAERVLVGAFSNLGAVVRAARATDHLAVLCAGVDGRFALDDALVAGHLLRRLDGLESLDDGARAALALAETMAPDEASLAGTAAGRAVTEAGLGADLAWCARVDRHDVVPVLKDGALVLAEG